MTSAADIAFLPALPGSLVVSAGDHPGSESYVSALKETIESLSLPGVVSIRSLKSELVIAFHPRFVDAQDLADMLKAADSAVRFAHGDHSPSSHLLPAMFGGPYGPDLSLASLLLGTTEAALIRSFCRKAHAVSGLAAPAASPMLDVSARHGLSPLLGTFRTRQAVMPGTLMLSASGITIAACEWFSDELLIGRVSTGEASSRRLFVGDLVRLCATVPELPVEE